MSNLKPKINNKGFTVMELVIVMGIVAILTVSIGASQLLSTRNRLQRDQLAEDLASEIRLARSYALGATEVDPASGSSFVPKAAIVRIVTQGEPEVKFLRSGCGTVSSKRFLGTDGRGIITIENPGGLTATGASINLVYASPYGRFFRTTTESFTADVNNGCRATNTPVTGDIRIKIQSNLSDTNPIYLRIDKDTGEVTVKTS